jgi:hypothetical protein
MAHGFDLVALRPGAKGKERAVMRRAALNRTNAKPKLGPELITNGGFAADTNWAKPAGVTITAGVLRFTNVASAATVTQDIADVVGGAYLVTYTISGYVGGSVRADFTGGGIGATRTANGTYTDRIVAQAPLGNFRFRAGAANTTLDIDNVSVRRIMP